VAYAIAGNELRILLNASCDEYFFLQGELNETGASGNVGHWKFTDASKQLGWFTSISAKRP